MSIGVPRETKPGERRVGLDVAAVAALAREGFAVNVESGAGAGIGASDDDYVRAGAKVATREEAWASDLVVKVKEIQAGEWERLRPGVTLFSFQHLVGAPALTRRLAVAGASVIAYEMVRDADGGFPLLAPMSIIAGRLAIEVGVTHGSGTERVLVLGAGHAGREAVRRALDVGAHVTVLCRRESRRVSLRREFGASLEVDAATPAAIERAALVSDIVVGAVFVAGAATPKLLPRSLVARMKRGAVIVDVCIEEGGVAETSRPTSHEQPTFVEEGVVHYAVGNMPASVPQLASRALAEAALPYVRRLAALGTLPALREDAGLRAGVLMWNGRMVHAGIAREAGLPCSPLP
jgi:alanine dehydrogenase